VDDRDFEMLRHGRQSRLLEVGPVGQEKIRRARVDVTVDGLAAEVAGRYLVGAGVGTVRVRDPELAALLRGVDSDVSVEIRSDLVVEDTWHDAFGFRDPTARALAHGAHFALRALRATLEASSS
jgi:hypothetical protein